MTQTLVRQVIFFGLCGFSLGLAQLLSLRTLLRHYIVGGSRVRTILEHAARGTLIVSAWVVLGRLGGASGLLAALVGFLVARPLVLARTKGASP